MAKCIFYITLRTSGEQQLLCREIEIEKMEIIPRKGEIVYPGDELPEREVINVCYDLDDHDIDIVLDGFSCDDDRKLFESIKKEFLDCGWSF
jgi:hypothetical protein